MKRKKKTQPVRKFFLSLLLIIITFFIGFFNHLYGLWPFLPEPSGNLTVTFLDVGQADAAIITCGGEVLMIDGGNVGDSQLIHSYLKNTMKINHIDYMISTHPHEDHIGGLAAALNACSTGVIYSPVDTYDSKAFRNVIEYADDHHIPFIKPKTGDSFLLGSAKVTFLWARPDNVGLSTNNLSLVIRIDFGQTSFLFTGDLESDAEALLLDSGRPLSATVLKVGHHGSSTSTSQAFLNAVSPEYAVISVSEKNAYGHPSAEVLARLKKKKIKTYRTDLLGHITCVSDGTKCTFSNAK